MSHVMCHASHVMCRVSRIMRHMSCIPCHMSPVMFTFSLATDPPPANSPTMLSRLVIKDPKINILLITLKSSYS